MGTALKPAGWCESPRIRLACARRCPELRLPRGQPRPPPNLEQVVQSLVGAEPLPCDAIGGLLSSRGPTPRGTPAVEGAPHAGAPSPAPAVRVPRRMATAQVAAHGGRVAPSAARAARPGRSPLSRPRRTAAVPHAGRGGRSSAPEGGVGEAQASWADTQAAGQ